MSKHEEQQLHNEIAAKMSGIDSVLMKAFQGMGQQNECTNSAQVIVDQIKEEKVEETKVSQDLTTDKLTNYDFESQSDLATFVGAFRQNHKKETATHRSLIKSKRESWKEKVQSLNTRAQQSNLLN